MNRTRAGAGTPARVRSFDEAVTGRLLAVQAQDYWWLHSLIVRAALAADGVRTEGRAMVHILFLATIRGLIVRGPVAGQEQAFVLTSDWLGPAPPTLDREAALGQLARRYLAGHAPAAAADLAKWAGIGLREARLGLARCGARERADGLAELASSPRTAPGPRHRACSARLTRCCSAGPHAIPSSGSTRRSLPSTASSARSPWSTGRPSRPGAWPADRSNCHRSPSCPRIRRARCGPMPSTCGGSWGFRPETPVCFHAG
jgi:hypothetical protein